MKPLALVSAAALTLAAGSAMAQIHDITPGQTIVGVLSEGEALPNDEPGDCYRFTLASDADVTAILRSPTLDTYLYVFDGGACDGEALYEDDDGDGDLNSRLSQRMTAGVYSIGASTLSDVLDDEYSVTLTALVTEWESPLDLPDFSAMIDDIAAWQETQQEPAALPPPPLNLPSLSAILAARDAEAAQAASTLTPPPPPQATPAPLPAPPAPPAASRPYLRVGEDMIAFFGDGTPRRNGKRFICWNLPGSNRLEMRLASDFPARVELFDGVDCPGAAVFTGSMSSGDVGYVLQSDTGPTRPRSVGVSGVVDGTGVIGMGAEVSTARPGPASGYALTPGGRVGSLSAPLAPAPVLDTEYTSDDATCRAAYLAFAEYAENARPASFVFSSVPAATYRMRAAQVPSPSGIDLVMSDTRAALFSSSMTMTTLTGADKEESMAALRVAITCDNRFGFTPVTGR